MLGPVVAASQPPSAACLMSPTAQPPPRRCTSLHWKTSSMSSNFRQGYRWSRGTVPLPQGDDRGSQVASAGGPATGTSKLRRLHGAVSATNSAGGSAMTSTRFDSRGDRCSGQAVRQPPAAVRRRMPKKRWAHATSCWGCWKLGQCMAARMPLFKHAPCISVLTVCCCHTFNSTVPFAAVLASAPRQAHQLAVRSRSLYIGRLQCYTSVSFADVILAHAHVHTAAARALVTFAISCSASMTAHAANKAWHVLRRGHATR